MTQDHRNGWVAINLATGDPYSWPMETPKAAMEGLRPGEKIEIIAGGEDDKG